MYLWVAIKKKITVTKYFECLISRLELSTQEGAIIPFTWSLPLPYFHLDSGKLTLNVRPFVNPPLKQSELSGSRFRKLIASFGLGRRAQQLDPGFIGVHSVSCLCGAEKRG